MITHLIGLMSKKKGNCNGPVIKPGYEIWLIYQRKINSIFYFFISKSYIPYFQLSTCLATVKSTLLLLFLYQLGYNLFLYQLRYNLLFYLINYNLLLYKLEYNLLYISTKFFLKKKSYVFYRAKAK